MINTDFSEFQYGYAVLYELLNGSMFNFKDGSLFKMPNLRQEAKVGYDLKITAYRPFYFQFKVPEFMKLSTATEYNSFNSSYYRYDLRNKKNNFNSSQHNTLFNLTLDKRNRVYYVSPMFHTDTDFDNFFLNNKICSCSLFLNVKRIGKYKLDSDHRIGYTSKPHQVIKFSEPEIIEGSHHFDDFIKDIDDKEIIYDLNEYMTYLVEKYNIHVKQVSNDGVVYDTYRKIQEYFISNGIFFFLDEIVALN
ncbi:MAG: hypothetical protein KJ971_03980 [Firmicutes bacterium]|nr:hypothetical protein [Bacillota bacterium]